MKVIVKLLLFLILISAVFAQTGSLSGIVTNKETGKFLEGANIKLNNSAFSTTTNKNGEFRIEEIPEGKYVLSISFVGYENKNIDMMIISGMTLEVETALTPAIISLGEITISSMKSDKLMKDIPLPIEVITEKQMESLPSISPADAISNEAGVSLMRDGIWATSVNIRGLSKQNVVTLVDGNRIETATSIAAGLSMVDVSDIEKIEVIKSGVSSLYGTGATGGIVNITTKSGSYSNSFHLNGFLSGTYSSMNKGSSGNLNLNAGSNNWFAKIGGTLRSADDTETPAGTLENSQFRDNNLSAALGITPFTNNELLINFQRFSAADLGIPGGDPFPANSQATYPTELREMYSAEYKIKNLSSSLINISAKYFHQLIERRVELISNSSTTVNTGADHTTDGLNLLSDLYLGRNNRLIAGIDAWQREYEGYRVRDIRAKNLVIGDYPVPNSKYRSIGVFAQDEMMLIENKLTMNIGARYDLIRVTNEETNNPAYIIVNGNRDDNPSPNPQASYPKNEIENSSWSLNIGTIYSITQQVDLTLNAARAFRSPTLEERYQYIDLGGDIYLGNPDLEPEKSYSFDAGIRVWYTDFSLKANVFLNLFDDLVTDQVVIADSLFQKTNVGKARLFGFDMGAEYNFYKKIVSYFTAAFVRGEDTGSNRDLAEIPPLNGRLGLRSPIAGIVNVDASMNYAFEQNKTAAGESATPGYALFNFYINTHPVDLGIADLQLFAGVENIFDKAYRNHLSTTRGLIILEPGRNIFAKVKLGW